MIGIPKNIEKQLAEANRRLKAASNAPMHEGDNGEGEEFANAQEEVLRLERELAKTRGEPFAVPCDFPVEWSVGAPLPYLLQNEDRAFLTFYVNVRDPNWDGTYVNVVDPSSPDAVTLCLVTFKNCLSAKLGHPNEDVQGGHPLAGRGLKGYTAQIVENSPWIREIGKTNSVHPDDDPSLWDSYQHYIFWFHDSTFECLARSYEYEVTTESMSHILSRIQTKLLQ